MTKSVIDAVNEFKGEWSNAEYGDVDVRFIFECIDNKDVTNSIGRLVGDAQNNGPENYREVCTREEFLQCVEEMSEAEWIKPVTPIYTKSMADNGELPLVGMKVGFLNEVRAYTVMLGADEEGDLIVSPVDGDYWQRAHKSDIKPIDTRTDTEKAIDDLFKLDESICNNIEWHKNFLDAIKAGKIHGVTFNGES